MKLPEFSVKQPVATFMLFLGIILIGIVSLAKLNIDMLPEVEPPLVSVITTWPGASATDVESEVTEVLENNLNALNNLDTLTSKSLDNLSLVSCKFEWGTNLDVATNDIRDKLDIAKRDLPKDVKPPIIFKFSTATSPIMFMTITGDKSWPRLYHIVDKEVSDQLKRVPGVGALIIYGGLRRRINVYFDLKKIEGYNLSLYKIDQILKAENLNIPSGSIKSGSREYFVRVPGRYKSVKEIKNTVIGYFRGHPVYLRDVAKVEDAYKPEELKGWGDGKKAIVLILQKQTGKNTVSVIRRVKKELKKIQKNLPSDVKINVVVDNSYNILLSIKNLRTTLFEGILFVILVTFVFLRRFRTAVIISLTIPFSLIISFIFLYFFGYTINVVSLMSLAIASGMVVDDGIVVLENIVRHIERGGRLKASAIFGASEMGMAITASTMSVVVVFVPLMFITGIVGVMFKQLAFVIVVTLLASLFTALSMTPMLSSRWITSTPEMLRKRKGLGGLFYRLGEWVLEKFENGYEKVLSWSLEHRKMVITLAIVLFASSISLFPFLSTQFIPDIDSGDVGISFHLPEGTRIEETHKVVEKILKIMDETVKPEEFKHSYAFDGSTEKGIGVALGFDEGPNIGEIGFKLVDSDKRKRSAKEIAYLLREKIKMIPGISKLKVSAKSFMISMLVGGRPINLEIVGTDLDLNYRFAKKLTEKLKNIPGLTDLSISQKEPRPELWVKVNREKASSLGLNIATIATTLRNYFYGVEASKFWDAGDNFDIFTRFSEEDKNRIENLANVPIFTPDGRMIRLKNIAQIVYSEGPVEIDRKNRQRIIMIEGDIYKRPLGDITKDIKRVLNKIEIPKGVAVKFGGEVEEQKKAFRDLTFMLVLGMVLVYMILASLYGNLRDPFIIMFSVPFALSGVFYAFYITGVTLDIMTFMGIIMLTGIVTKNAIVLLDYIHLLQKRGIPLFDAITLGGKNRLRPILMTTLTTFFGMLPMAISKRVGAEIWNPLGITILGGLSLSAFISLLLIPTVYYMFEKRKS
ncbi:MAG: efflux RND transporter permease subunit [Deltaproteobacteria bacterium]|nr:efflux RND transporter permease subunit [Deltaproteobacteria bacterium]